MPRATALARPRIKVALAGATGMIGMHIWQAFSQRIQYDLTILIRSGSVLPSSLPTEAQVRVVDYDSDESMKTALRGQQVLISALGKTALEVQPRLFRAAVAAGVQRIFPSEFGGDLRHPKTRQFPTYQLKVAVEEQLEQYRAEAGTSYTLIFSNVLLDWGLSTQGALLLDPALRVINIYDGGNQKFSTTTISTVGRAVVAALDKYNETANRALYIHDTELTSNELLQMVREITAEDGGQDWTASYIDTLEAEREAREMYKTEGITFPVFYGFAVRGAFANGYGGHFTSRDNDLLGIQEMSPDQVREVVRRST